MSEQAHFEEHVRPCPTNLNEAIDYIEQSSMGEPLPCLYWEEAFAFVMRAAKSMSGEHGAMKALPPNRRPAT